MREALCYDHNISLKPGGVPTYQVPVALPWQPIQALSGTGLLLSAGNGTLVVTRDPFGTKKNRSPAGALRHGSHGCWTQTNEHTLPAGPRHHKQREGFVGAVPLLIVPPTTVGPPNGHHIHMEEWERRPALINDEIQSKPTLLLVLQCLQLPK